MAAKKIKREMLTYGLSVLLLFILFCPLPMDLVEKPEKDLLVKTSNSVLLVTE